MGNRTPSQTIGPFFHVGLKWEDGEKVQFAGTGERVVLTGCVYDGGGTAIADALVETWQADPSGKVPGAGAAVRAYGYSRAMTGSDGRYTIETLMPGACTGAGGEKYAPQINVTIFARGLLKAVRTRVFLAAADATRDDPLARAAGARAGTLIASQDAKDRSVWRWDVRLQGKDETAFIDF
ncbi:MAG: protocatechuate 3,4-dioxygenase subunit alpha [Proteobacteria bacterium]|nr:protocatechuate 3,4-dioxygenase subunit alpha [Pseudomonadota bacterium]